MIETAKTSTVRADARCGFVDVAVVGVVAVGRVSVWPIACVSVCVCSSVGVIVVVVGGGDGVVDAVDVPFIQAVRLMWL